MRASHHERRSGTASSTSLSSASWHPGGDGRRTVAPNSAPSKVSQRKQQQQQQQQQHNTRRRTSSIDNLDASIHSNTSAARREMTDNEFQRLQGFLERTGFDCQSAARSRRESSGFDAWASSSTDFFSRNMSDDQTDVSGAMSAVSGATGATGAMSAASAPVIMSHSEQNKWTPPTSYRRKKKSSSRQNVRMDRSFSTELYFSDQDAMGSNEFTKSDDEGMFTNHGSNNKPSKKSSRQKNGGSMSPVPMRSTRVYSPTPNGFSSHSEHHASAMYGSASSMRSDQKGDRMYMKRHSSASQSDLQSSVEEAFALSSKDNGTPNSEYRQEIDQESRQRRGRLPSLPGRNSSSHSKSRSSEKGVQDPAVMSSWDDFISRRRPSDGYEHGSRRPSNRSPMRNDVGASPQFISENAQALFGHTPDGPRNDPYGWRDGAAMKMMTHKSASSLPHPNQNQRMLTRTRSSHSSHKGRLSEDLRDNEAYSNSWGPSSFSPTPIQWEGGNKDPFGGTDHTALSRAKSLGNNSDLDTTDRTSATSLMTNSPYSSSWEHQHRHPQKQQSTSTLGSVNSRRSTSKPPLASIEVSISEHQSSMSGDDDLQGSSGFSLSSPSVYHRDMLSSFLQQKGQNENDAMATAMAFQAFLKKEQNFAVKLVANNSEQGKDGADATPNKDEEKDDADDDDDDVSFSLGPGDQPESWGEHDDGDPHRASPVFHGDKEQELGFETVSPHQNAFAPSGKASSTVKPWNRTGTFANYDRSSRCLEMLSPTSPSNPAGDSGFGPLTRNESFVRRKSNGVLLTVEDENSA